MKLKTKRFNQAIPLPKYQPEAAGFDFFCRQKTVIQPGKTKAIPSNVAIEIPLGYVILVIPRSSTACRLGIMMPHSVGVIDPFYKGDDNEIMLIFYNFTDRPAVVEKGERIAQGLLLKCEKADFEEVKKLTQKARKSRWQKPKREEK